MSKDKLIGLIKVMFLLLALGFAYVLIRSLGGPSNFTNPKNAFDDVAVGQTAARRVGSKRVWVTRLSSVNRSQAEELSSLLVDANAGCAAMAELCVLLAATGRSGIDIIYSEAAPAQLPADIAWFGGFVDPTTSEIFDRLGRAYKAGAVSRTHLDELPLKSTNN